MVHVRLLRGRRRRPHCGEGRRAVVGHRLDADARVTADEVERRIEEVLAGDGEACVRASVRARAIVVGSGRVCEATGAVRCAVDDDPALVRPACGQGGQGQRARPPDALRVIAAAAGCARAPAQPRLWIPTARSAQRDPRARWRLDLAREDDAAIRARPAREAAITVVLLSMEPSAVHPPSPLVCRRAPAGEGRCGQRRHGMTQDTTAAPRHPTSHSDTRASPSAPPR